MSGVRWKSFNKHNGVIKQVKHCYSVNILSLTLILPCNTYILLDVLLSSIAEYFYELCRILASP